MFGFNQTGGDVTRISDSVLQTQKKTRDFNFFFFLILEFWIKDCIILIWKIETNNDLRREIEYRDFNIDNIQVLDTGVANYANSNLTEKYYLIVITINKN